MVAIIQEDPHKERTDRIVTRWLKRHLHRLGAAVNLDQLDSLVEDKAMLAENLENLVKKERLEGRQEGRLEGRQEANRETARNLIKLAVLSDQQIAEATGLTVVDVQRLREDDLH
jgi:predicted transposase/invertase (TIGR01784 family)